MGVTLSIRHTHVGHLPVTRMRLALVARAIVVDIIDRVEVPGVLHLVDEALTSPQGCSH